MYDIDLNVEQESFNLKKACGFQRDYSLKLAHVDKTYWLRISSNTWQCVATNLQSNDLEENDGKITWIRTEYSN